MKSTYYQQKNNSNWGFGLDFNLLSNSSNNDVINFITPDSLLKQPEQRVTRSRSTGSVPIVTTTYKKKKSSRPKKLYCICQQPYNGKPMVQCDHCEEWFHCVCVHFDPDLQDEDLDWICNKCEQETKQDTASHELPNPLETRQTRYRQPSTCLYKGCNNSTRADSYCSDVCARKDETITPTRRSRPKKKEESEDEYTEEQQQEEEEEQDKQSEHLEKKQEEKNNEEEEVSAPNSPSQMTAEENPVRRNVVKNMSTILKSIMESAVEKDPQVFDSQPVQERAETLAKSIESTMFSQLGDRGRTCGEVYKNKFRSLLHNLKDKANQTFQLRIVTGDLSPLELIKMSSEDMANPELKSKAEILRQKSLKNSILKLENMPIIKKTHKGDIIMIPTKESHDDEDAYHQSSTPTTPTVVKQQELANETPSSVEPSSRSAEPMDDILARIGIQDEQKRNASNLDNNRVKKRRVTADLEELLGEEEETPFEIEEMDMTEQEKEEKEDETQEVKLPSVWQGRVNMPQVAEFEACARQIGGRQLNEEEWAEVLSPTMWIEGRIPADRVTNYITQTQYSSSREIILIQVEARSRQTQVTLNEEQAQTLLDYLETRQRYAVVGHNKTKIKDFYLIPLKRMQQIPDCLYVVRVEETKRDCDLFLGVLVLQKAKSFLPYNHSY
ncbi:hypothetical protein G6F62_009228 [Rhizopus arrhizus]|nr:hypothetical protein G6F62_009228 [Rhizopus arrhizus]